MSKRRKIAKVFNRVQAPDTYIIIFLVVVVAALMTLSCTKGDFTKHRIFRT